MASGFQGLSILITGATGGFGRAAATRLFASGANLVLSDISAEGLDKFTSELGDSSRIATLAGRIEEESLSADLVALALSRFNRLDIAINNAGIAHKLGRLPDIDSAEARRVVDIDLMGVFYAMKHQLPVMDRQFKTTGKGGTILNVASIAGVVGVPNGSVYAAAKHGVVGMTKAAALEYAKRNIRVNALCPAFARTPMVMNEIEADAASGRMTHEEAEAHLVRGIPMRRLAEVDEIIQALMFAISPDNTFMTGQTIQVDGGLSAV